MSSDDLPNIHQLSLKDKLLNPQIAARTPLDKIFAEIVAFLDVPEGKGSKVELIYRKISSEETDNFHKRWTIVSKALEYLSEVQVLSNLQKEAAQNKDLITISLPDMKIFGELLNLIIVDGFYSLLPSGVGVPLDRRRLRSFNKVSVTVTRVKDPLNAEKLLQLLVSGLYDIFERGGDVRGLLMRGSGYSDLLTGSISLLFNPNSDPKQKDFYMAQFHKIEKMSPTFELFSIYTLLLQPYSQPWVKAMASKRLSSLIIERHDGVMSLIEFVVGMRDDEEINIEKIDHVSRILISKPQTVSSTEYFGKVGSQLFEIFGMLNRPLLISIAMHVVESIFERNENIVKDFIFTKIWRNFNPNPSDQEVLTDEKTLNNTFNVILSLSKKSSPQLLDTLFDPILLPLWGYLIFNKKSGRETGLILEIFVSFFTLTNNQVALDLLVYNLLMLHGERWRFETGPNGLIQIVNKTDEIEPSNEDFFKNLETAVGLMIDILKDIDDELLRSEFAVILKRWLKVSDTEIESLTSDENPYLLLIDLKLLESIVENFKERLSKSPEDMLIVVKNILQKNQEMIDKKEHSEPEPRNSVINSIVDEAADSDDEDEQDEENDLSESLKVVLELLSAILSETAVETLSKNCVKLLKEIVEYLKRIELNNSAANSLRQRIERLLEGNISQEKSELQIDKATLTRALTSLNDPLIPIRAHGLFLLRQLIEKKSEAISLEFVIDLHLLQLKDPEPFIYLNVIKGLDALLLFNKTETLPVLLSIYGDGKYALDERLRVGEVLLRFIDHANNTLSGNTAKYVMSTILGIVRVPADQLEKQDNRLRMSAMSLLGVCSKSNPAGIAEQLPDAFDCVLGILNLETLKDELIMRRSAIVLINDLITGPGGLESVPQTYGKKCLTLLNYVAETDNDLLVREQLKDVIFHIQELFRLQFTSEENESYKIFKV